MQISSPLTVSHPRSVKSGGNSFSIEHTRMRLKAGDALGAMAAGRPAASEYSVSRAVQYLKGKSSHKPLTEHQKAILGQHLWSRGCWVASSGNVTDEVWKKYIEDQKPEKPDDNFKVI
jgi:hypothetical protein